MSMLKNDQASKGLVCGPSRVKKDERQDVDINKLVASQGLARLTRPQPQYADLTKMPKSYGEAISRLQALREVLPVALQGMSFHDLFSMTPAQVHELMTPASDDDDSNDKVRAGSSAKGKTEQVESTDAEGSEEPEVAERPKAKGKAKP